MIRVCFLCILAVFFIACDNKKDIAISDNEGNTKELNSMIENVDTTSYEGLENVFFNTSNIESKDKPIMLIFAKNNCLYCEKLKQYIKDHSNIANILESDVKSYYINTSYSKDHNVAYLHRSLATDAFSSIYDLSGTPLIIFLEPSGEEILRVEGFRDDVFVAMVDFVKDGKYKNINSTKERMKVFSQDFQESLKKAKT